MLRHIALVLAAVLVAAPAAARQESPAAVSSAVPYRVLTGTLTRADYERYREVPFTLPEGVTRVTVRFSYGGKEQHSVIDLGLADPQRFRGWSGGTRDHMTLSAEDATPGYLPGPLPAGTWRLILGAPNIREGARAPFEARIFIERAPHVTSFADTPLKAQTGWYRGDLHMHSGNSDGKCAAQSGARAPCPVYRTLEAAAARKLDFIALTDHNTTAHYDDLRALQPAFDRLLLVPGREITTFWGHSNVFGPTDFLDFRMRAGTWKEARMWIDAVHREGGLVSINHAGAPSGEICMGCGWRIADLPVDAIDAVEVVNGGTMSETGSAESPLQGLDLWTRLLDAGWHVTGIGGSDNHNADAHAGEPGAVGTPTTVVYMPALSLDGFLAGVRAGRVFIDVEGSSDRLVDLTAEANGRTATMGGVLAADAGTSVRLRAHVIGVTGGLLQFIIDGTADPQLSRPTSGGDETLAAEWRADGGRHWIRADIRDANGRLVLIGNPIYIQAR